MTHPNATDDKDARVWGGHHESRALVYGIQANGHTQASNANLFITEYLETCKSIHRLNGVDTFQAKSLLENNDEYTAQIYVYSSQIFIHDLG